jgi:hypothetical protein
VRRIAPGFLFLETTHRPLARFLRDALPLWEGISSRFRLPPAEHVGRSARSICVRLGIDEVKDDDEQEAWLSTELLCLVLMTAVAKARELDRRDRAHLLFNFFAERVLTAEVANDLASTDVPAGLPNQCVIGVQGGRCECLRTFLQQFQGPRRGTRSPQWHAAETILEIFLKVPVHCEDGRLWVKLLVQMFASAAQQSLSSWGDADWHGTSVAALVGVKRNRRIDPHVKRRCVRDSLADGISTSVAEAVRHVAVGSKARASAWIGEEMAAYQASCQLQLGSEQVLSITVDGARVGKPARELLCGIVSASGSCIFASLPPQVGSRDCHFGCSVAFRSMF